MKKKTSTVAIVVAVICSILLFPLIAIGGAASGAVFSAEELLKPDREEAIYETFTENGGIDYIYDLLLQESAAEIEEFGVAPEEFFPRQQVETMVYDVYHALIKGENFQADFSHQKEVVREISMEQFEAQIDTVLKEEYGENYDMLTETQKAEAKEEARRVYTEEMDSFIEEEFGTLEKELSEEINGLYELPEFQEIKALEKEIGFSLTDRTELCAVLRMAGYIMLGITAFLILLLLLSHLFRPSGFFTAGGVTLVIGGCMTLFGMAVPVNLKELLLSEFGNMNFEADAELVRILFIIINEVIVWCMEGFKKVGMYGVMASVVLILIGILLFIIRKNKTDAEPVTGMQ